VALAERIEVRSQSTAFLVADAAGTHTAAWVWGFPVEQLGVKSMPSALDA